MTKIALVTGVSGQDGSYPAEFLLEKGYEVHGIERRSSSFNSERIDDIYEDPDTDHARFILHYGDITDSTNLTRILQQVGPDEIYNLAAQSHTVCRNAFTWEASTRCAIGVTHARDHVEMQWLMLQQPEVETLLGDASKARCKLGWEPAHPVRAADGRDAARRSEDCGARCPDRAARLSVNRPLRVKMSKSP